MTNTLLECISRACSLLQGELEQLTISKECSAVSEQCSPVRIPMTIQDNDDDDSQMDSGFQGDDPYALTSVTSKEKYGIKRIHGKLNY